ncbi:hypothetical protein VOLCADRAFT_88690, partial [Volvox carteri f. nagariensis]
MQLHVRQVDLQCPVHAKKRWVSAPLRTRQHPKACFQQQRKLSDAYFPKPHSKKSNGSNLVVRSSDDNKIGAKTYAPKTAPSDRVLSIWRRVDAVCFDVDCTITVNDSLDLLAEFMGVKDQVQELTNKGIKELITALQARGVAIYLISGGFRELTLPIAAYLGIPKSNVFANRMNWQWDDETGEPTKLVGFDLSEPTAHNQGKPEAIARIRQRNPYNTVVMIGDGITDLEAVQITGGADLFIGYGGVVERPAVAAEAE